jgi:GNAT superfamily N-acetyltransferase
MQIRPYDKSDAEAIVTLFHDTVHRVCAADYTPEQLRAWAPEIPDAAVWHERMAQGHTLVVEEKGQLFAFAKLAENGCLHMFFCRHDVQRQGIGSWLFSKIKTAALDAGMARITTEASITARPFFERQGFVLVKENRVTRAGVELTNYTMEKALS